MLYRNFIKIDRQFELAVNLGLDLNKHKKLEEYIPTDSSVSLLKEYLKNIDNNGSERASVLIGPYGKGKSHLILVLCALVGMNVKKRENYEALQKLVNNISKQDQEAANIASRIIESKKRFMPVIINGGYEELQQAFLLALKEALDREGIDNITPITYYDMAIKTIKKWENEYPETLKLFEEKLSKKKYTVEQLMNLLTNYDKKAYKLFCELHPIVSSGSLFNPMINMDVVTMYKGVNEELCKSYGYSGILVIFDEFSKFLDNAKVHAPGELKILQDFAEFTNRNGNQVHLICITHKPIGNYSKDLPKEKALAYRTVEGRFKELYFISSAEQNYNLIRNSIQREDKEFNDYVSDNKLFFEELRDQVTSLGIFPQRIDLLDEIVVGCFPLHPMTTFMSIRISELVAQNERTLFTFLASHQKNTLRSFIDINKKVNKTLTMDRLYDYFKDGIKKELSNEHIVAVYTQTENLLKQDITRIQKKILKCMALINMINQPGLIQATPQVIKVAVNEESEIFEQQLNDLIRKHHIFKRNSDDVLVCLNTSTTDIRNKINECKQLKVKNINRKDILGKLVDMKYSLPKSFNDRYEMIRFFKNEIISYEELMTITNVDEMLLDKKCDGLVGYLIYDEKDDLGAIEEKIKQLADKRILIYVPNQPFTIDEYLREYVAIELLKNDKSLVENDRPVLEELSLYQLDTVDAINNYVTTYFSLDNEEHTWISQVEEAKEINSKIQLSRILSRVCEEIYYYTPKIASELINKHNISGPIVTARNKVIANILEGMPPITTGNSPDATITRAVITNKYVLEDQIDDRGLEMVLREINRFICEADGKLQNIGILYKTLYSAPFGIRKGVIPIYLAIYLKKYSNNLIIYNQLKEVELSTETIKFIDKEPSSYSILLEEGTKEKLEYITELANVFGIDTSGMNFYNQCDSIVEKMKNWFRSLPKCSRELSGETVENTCIIDFRKELIKLDINPREFLFEILPQKVCKKDNLSKCIVSIIETKKICEEYFNTLVENLVIELKEIFVPGYVGELAGALKSWYMTLESHIEKYMFSMQTNKLLDMIRNLQDCNELNILTRLGYEITGLYLEDWTQETITTFIEQIYGVIKEINDVNIQEQSEEDVQIAINVNGKLKQKVIRNEELSPLGETLFTNLGDALEEYGDSIDTTEKMNILVKLIERLM